MNFLSCITEIFWIHLCFQFVFPSLSYFQITTSSLFLLQHPYGLSGHTLLCVAFSSISLLPGRYLYPSPVFHLQMCCSRISTECRCYIKDVVVNIFCRCFRGGMVQAPKNKKSGTVEDCSQYVVIITALITCYL